LPTPAEALAEPFRAFPAWFLRIECDRCGKVQLLVSAARQFGNSSYSALSMSKRASTGRSALGSRGR
jgi:hypothetical protein